MITTTHSPSPRDAARRRTGGFTLVEVLISAGLAAFVLTGVMTAFLFLGRSGANIQNYNDMESQARRALETFAQDTRQASSITWTSSTTVTLTVDSSPVMYTFTSGSFIRRTATSTTTLVTGITSFEFKAYNINGAELSLADLTAANRSTKQLQISLEAARSSATVATATNLVLSARFILRNKIVTA